MSPVSISSPSMNIEVGWLADTRDNDEDDEEDEEKG